MSSCSKSLGCGHNMVGSNPPCLMGLRRHFFLQSTASNPNTCSSYLGGNITRINVGYLERTKQIRYEKDEVEFIEGIVYHLEYYTLMNHLEETKTHSLFIELVSLSHPEHAHLPQNFKSTRPDS